MVSSPEALLPSLAKVTSTVNMHVVPPVMEVQLVSCDVQPICVTV
jgi:hypothetical protein